MSDTRAKLQRFYALTDQLKVQLQALDEAVPGARIEFRHVDSDGDTTGLAFLVMMAASRSAQEDLRAIMAQIKAITDQKQKLRDLLDQRPERGVDAFSVLSVMSAVTTKAELCRVIEEMNLDSMSTLSNILKKVSDTSSQIAQNLK
jgi:septation ring formation regulator EzrA